MCDVVHSVDSSQIAYGERGVVLIVLCYVADVAFSSTILWIVDHYSDSV